jgi:hypothetical protein
MRSLKIRTKKVGRPRKHDTDSVGCLIRIPLSTVKIIDGIGPTRQDAVMGLIEKALKYRK